MPRSRFIIRAAVLAAAAALIVPLPGSGEESPVISTVAGGTIHDALAEDVSLRPSGVALAPDGTRYVADAGAGRVWSISVDGRANVLAGTGRSCRTARSTAPTDCATDRDPTLPQPAHEAYLPNPNAVAVGPDGAVYFSDTQAHQVFRILGGIVELFAGDGDTEYDPLEEGAPREEISLRSPTGLAFDPQGRLHIADTGHNVIRRVDDDGTVSIAYGCISECRFGLRDRTPLATSVLSAPSAFTFAPDGRLFLATATAVYTPDHERGMWLRVAGDSFTAAGSPGQGEGGPAERARFKTLSALASGPGGELYLADAGWNRLQRIDAPVTPDSIVRHVGGCSCADGFSGDGGPAVDATFALEGTATPRGWIAVDPDGAVLVGDQGNHRVRQIGVDGTVTTLAGNGIAAPADNIHRVHDFQPSKVNGGFSGDGRAATGAQLFAPSDVVADGAGNVYLLERYAHRVRRIGADGVITTVAGSGCAGRGCSINRVPLGDGGPATSARLGAPTAIALDKTGTQLYIADERHYRVRQVNLSDAAVTVYPSASAPITIAPGAIATVVGSGNHCVNVTFYCGDGRFATEITVSDLSGLALDGAGNLFFADTRVQQVRRVDAATGVVSAVIGVPFHAVCEPTTQENQPGLATFMCGPTAMAVGPDGALYVAESGDYGFGSGYTGRTTAPRIRRVDLADRTYRSTVVAGTGVPGVSGDGGAARSAKLAYPQGLAFAPDGSLYVSDTGNSRIRRIKDGTITTVAGIGEFIPGPQGWALGSFSGYDMLGCSYSGDGGAATQAGLCAPLGITFAGDTLYVADQINNAIRAVRGL